MRYCKSIFATMMLMLAVMCSTVMYSTAQAAEPQWYWISSDNSYTKWFDTASVQVQEAYGGAATRVTAVTKTGYSYAGAKETLDNYGIKTIRPNDLSFSLATVQICPQTRTMAYLEEAFYDKNGKKIWSKQYQPLKYKEMNSLEFDEDFYAYIVDCVFGAGELKRAKAADRWLTMWQYKLSNGGTASCIADTTTMRMNGENIIFWEWQEYKKADGSLSEIRFLKKAVNISQYTGKIVSYQHWNSTEGWKDYTDKETDGAYHAIEKGSSEEKELLQLAAYEAAHKAWVHRYTPAG